MEEVEKLENGVDGDVDVSAERDEIDDRDDRDGSVESVEEEREIEERRYDPERMSVMPTVSKIESMRCKHNTNTGIF